MWPHSKAQRDDGKGGAGITAGADPLPGILAEYGWLIHEVRIQPIPPGFSGARVWKVEVDQQVYALRQWPAGHPVHLSLEQIHALMRKAVDAGLASVPRVIAGLKGQGFVAHTGSFWDVTTWQPGEADGSPDLERLCSAMQVLSRLHALWRSAMPLRKAVCTAVQLQYDRLGQWSEHDILLVELQPGLQQLDRVAMSLFKAHRHSAMKRLEPWLQQKMLLQPCLADIWSDHVLFTGNSVTGIIDYGGTRYDHPAQDLARLLGSYALASMDHRTEALHSYQPITEEMEKLVMTLDRCGAVVGLGNWLRWLYLEGRPFDKTRVHERMQVLMNRL